MERREDAVVNGGPPTSGGQLPRGGFAGSVGAQRLGHPNFLNTGENYIQKYWGLRGFLRLDPSVDFVLRTLRPLRP